MTYPWQLVNKMAVKGLNGCNEKLEICCLTFLIRKTAQTQQFLYVAVGRGQLISKPIYGLLTSPKKRTDEFDLFAFLLFTANKSNSSVRFLGESTARQSAFRN